LIFIKAAIADILTAAPRLTEVKGLPGGGLYRYLVTIRVSFAKAWGQP
jgi:hypothetical protein